MATKEKDNKEKDKVEEQKQSRAGIPKDWIPPTMQISTDIKFCDMKVDMKDYALQITEYIYVQMVKNQIAYLKDAAEYIKKCFEEEFKGCWHVVCGVNFGSYFNYESKACILLYRNHVGFLIWKFG